jgi:hypothetical protein
MQPHELAEGSATPKRRSSAPSRTATAFRGRTPPGSGATLRRYYNLKANSKIKAEVGTQTFTALAEELDDICAARKLDRAVYLRVLPAWLAR